MPFKPPAINDTYKREIISRTPEWPPNHIHQLFGVAPCVVCVVFYSNTNVCIFFVIFIRRKAIIWAPTNIFDLFHGKNSSTQIRKSFFLQVKQERTIDIPLAISHLLRFVQTCTDWHEHDCACGHTSAKRVLVHSCVFGSDRVRATMLKWTSHLLYDDKQGESHDNTIRFHHWHYIPRQSNAMEERSIFLTISSRIFSLKGRFCEGKDLLKRGEWQMKPQTYFYL